MRVAAGLLVALAGTAAMVRAYVSNGHVWPTSSVPYYVNASNNDVSEAAAEAAIRQGADAWSVQSDASFAFYYAGRVQSPVISNDGRNHVFFRNTSNGSIIAETMWTYDSGGDLIDADIVFYDGGYRFFTGTSGCVSGYYVEDIATHEFGHALGLGHSTLTDATMVPGIAYCAQFPRTLFGDDIAGVEALYPPLPPQPPAAPYGLSAGPSASSPSTAVSLTWQDRSSNEDTFLVERSTSGAAFRQVATLPANTTSHVDQGLLPATNYTYRVRASNIAGVSAYTNTAGTTTAHPAPPPTADYDGDQRADPTLFRPGAVATWFTALAAGGARSLGWGTLGDLPVPGDYDGDRRTDPAVYRPSTGTWFVRGTTAGAAAIAWGGAAGDVPVPADYDGDGKTDVAVFRPATGTWWIARSRASTSVVLAWGKPGDIPVPGDYDGDGSADPAVFRGGTWYQLRSSGIAVAVAWGAATDTPVAADYDGDGKLDAAVFRPAEGRWYLLRSALGPASVPWGLSGDTPVAGDYDGDGKADPTVFRPPTGTWYQLRSASGSAYGLVWGQAGDQPL